MMHIYYGDGKGKTTAAVGLAVRAVGRGFRVLFVQFLKSEDSGERIALSQLDNITLTPCPLELDFTFNMNDNQKLQASKIFRSIFDSAVKTALTEKYDMLILDEVFSAIETEMLKESEVYSFLANAPNNMEIVLTGHNPPESILSLADYVSHIVKEKHPYDKGISARKGIEY